MTDHECGAGRAPLIGSDDNPAPEGWKTPCPNPGTRLYKLSRAEPGTVWLCPEHGHQVDEALLCATGRAIVHPTLPGWSEPCPNPIEHPFYLIDKEYPQYFCTEHARYLQDVLGPAYEREGLL